MVVDSALQRFLDIFVGPLWVGGSLNDVAKTKKHCGCGFMITRVKTCENYILFSVATRSFKVVVYVYIYT